MTNMPVQSSPTPPSDPALTGSVRVAADSIEQDSTAGVLGSNGVTVITGLAFVALLVTYTLVGDQAAGIAFWAVMFGLPALFAVVSALGVAWRGNSREEWVERDERLEIALLALRLSEKRRADCDRAANDDPSE